MHRLGVLALSTALLFGCKRKDVDLTEPDAPPDTGGPTPELVVQAGAHHYLSDLEFSPDGRFLALTSFDGLLKVIDVRTGKEWRSYSGASGLLHVVAWSPDGRRIAAGGQDRTVHVWDVATGAEIASLTGHTGQIGSLEFSPDGRHLASASSLFDLAVAVWDVEQKQLRQALQHTAAVRDLAWSRDGKTLVTATSEVAVWNTESGGRLGAIAVDPDGAGRRSLRFSPDGTMLAIDGKGDVVHLYDTGLWGEINQHPGGSLLGWLGADLVVHTGSAVARLDPRSGQRRGGFSGDASLRKAEFTLDGRLLANLDKMQADIHDGSSGARVRTVESAMWRQIHGVFGNMQKLLQVAWSPTAPVIAMAGFDGALRVVDLRRGASPRSVQVSKRLDLQGDEALMFGVERARIDPIGGITFSNDGQQILTRDGDGVSLWDTRTLALVRRFDVAGPLAEAFAPDGKTLAVASYPADVSVYDLTTGDLVRKHERPGVGLECDKSSGMQTYARAITIAGLGWSGDGSKFEIAYHESAAFVEVDARTFEPTRGGCAHRNPVNAVAWSDKRDRMAVGAGFHMVGQYSGEHNYSDNDVRVFDMTSGKPLYNLAGHKLAVFAADFSPDGGLLATASADRTARLWDTASGKEVATLAGHGAEVDAVAFSHDNKFLATASYDLSVKIWDVAARKEVATIVTIGPDGHVIATPDNYYTASRAGFESVSFRLGDGVVPVELFDLRLNRPDLVLARFGYAPPDLLALYEKAHVKRLKKMGLDESALRPEYHLPTLRLGDDLPVSTPDRRVRLQVTAEDTRYTLDRLQVYVNDVPIHGTAGIDLRAEKTRRHARDLEVDLLPGRNKIQVAVLNSAGTESLKQTVEVVSTASAAPADLVVVAVGVSKYADVRLNLKYAAKDARDIAELFKTRGQRFKTIDTVQILDGEARRETILAARERLAATSIDDQVVVFVAGHGMLDQNLDYYFVTHDFDRDKPPRRGLSYDQLESLLDGIPARRKLMLMDTCHSGEVDEDAVRAPPPLPGSPEVKVVTSGFRTFSYGGAVQSPDRSAELLGQLFADLRRGSGAAVISSAGGAEFALESARWQNGVFTYSLLQGLVTGAADHDRDGTIRVSELRDYVVGEVQRLTRGAQTPTSRRENLEFDFPVL